MSNFQEKDSKVNGRWTKGQHQKFLLGLQLYGKNWKKIQELVGTRSGSQIRSHAQKYFLKGKKTEEGFENSSNVHETVDCAQPSTVISKFSPEAFEGATEFSFFMGQIIKASASNLNFDFWSQFMDVKSQKREQTQTAHLKRKDSFVSFEGVNDCKNETPITLVHSMSEYMA